MIRIEVGLALRLTDGYTGAPVDGKTLLFTIDGVSKKAVVKPGGYCVFTGIPAGTHTVSIQSLGYLPETFSFAAGPGLLPVALKPGKNYRYSPESTCFVLENREQEEREVWVGRIVPELSLKVAQSDLQEGDTEVRLYAEGKASGLSLPGYMLLLDGKETEVVLLTELSGEEKSRLSTPLWAAHKRGCLLAPAQRYELAAGETAEIRFPEGTRCAFWVPAGKALVLPDTARGTVTMGGKTENGK